MALWSFGFILFALLLAATGALTWIHVGRLNKAPLPKEAGPKTGSQRELPIIRWLFLAFVPVSLMLSVTSYLSANLSAAPILWMVPLSLYLLTYIFAFSARLKDRPQLFWGRWMPVVVLAVLLTLLIEATEPLWLIFSLHLFGLFWIGMLCHKELAASRPPVNSLTTFYLCIAAGGAMAGLFNAIVAPLMFNTVAEYPLMLAVAALVPHKTFSGSRAVNASRRSTMILDWMFPLSLGLVTWLLITIVPHLHIPAGPVCSALIFGVPLVICYTFTVRPIRFALGIGALLIAANFYSGVYGAVEAHFRSFFGVHRVTSDTGRRYRLLIHGNTEHGRQALDPTQRTEPLAYYHRTGPVGDLLSASAVRSTNGEKSPLLAWARARSPLMRSRANSGHSMK